MTVGAMLTTNHCGSTNPYFPGLNDMTCTQEQIQVGKYSSLSQEAAKGHLREMVGAKLKVVELTDDTAPS